MKEAMTEVEASALSQRAPVGLFGAKWLMAMNQVTNVLRDAKKEGPAHLVHTRQLYGRDAKVSYHFSDDMLIHIIVIFLGSSSDEAFQQTQMKLSADYASMPTATRRAEHKLSSKKEYDRFAIHHTLDEREGMAIEIISFYRHRGENTAEPKVE